MIIVVEAGELKLWDVLKIGGTAPETVVKTRQMKPIGNVFINDKYEFSYNHPVRIEREESN